MVLQRHGCLSDLFEELGPKWWKSHFQKSLCGLAPEGHRLDSLPSASLKANARIILVYSLLKCHLPDLSTPETFARAHEAQSLHYAWSCHHYLSQLSFSLPSTWPTMASWSIKAPKSLEDHCLWIRDLSKRRILSESAACRTFELVLKDVLNRLDLSIILLIQFLVTPKSLTIA